MNNKKITQTCCLLIIQISTAGWGAEQWSITCAVPPYVRTLEGAYVVPDEVITPPPPFTPDFVVKAPLPVNQMDYKAVWGYTSFDTWSGWSVSPALPADIRRVLETRLKVIKNPNLSASVPNLQWATQSLAPSLAYLSLSPQSSHYNSRIQLPDGGNTATAVKSQPLEPLVINGRFTYGGGTSGPDIPYSLDLEGVFTRRDAFDYKGRVFDGKVHTRYRLQCILTRTVDTALSVTPSDLSCPTFALGSGVKACGEAKLNIRGAGRGHHIKVNLENSSADGVVKINVNNTNEITVNGTPTEMMPSTDGDHKIIFKIDTDVAKRLELPSKNQFSIKFTSTYQ